MIRHRFSSRERIRILRSRSEVHQHIGETAQASRDAERALESALAMGDPLERIQSLLRLAGVCFEVRDFDRSADLARQVLELEASRPEPATRGQAADYLGMIAMVQGRSEEALGFFRQGLSAFRESGDRASEAGALLNIGRQGMNLGRFEEAGQCYREAEALSRDFPREKAGVLQHLGDLAALRGDQPEALALFEKCLAIRREIGDAEGEEEVLNNLGVLFSRMGDWSGARAAFEGSLAMERRIGDRLGEVVTLSNLGAVFSKLDDYPRALELYGKSLALSRELKLSQDEAAVEAALGGTLERIGNFAEAVTHYERALTLFRGIGHREGEAGALSFLGRVALARGDRMLGFGLLKEAREIAVALDARPLLFSIQTSRITLFLETRDLPALHQAMVDLHGLLEDLQSEDWKVLERVFSACALVCEGREGAEEAFGQAAGFFRDRSQRWEEARAGLRFGKALGREKGRPYLKKAQALFSEIGAAGWAELCEEALRG
jgi:tetratricopeptide (TPR) repeat protein